MIPILHTLKQLIQVCRSALAASEKYEGHVRILSYLQHALVDDRFIKECFGDDSWTGKRLIYRDPDLGFCIRAHSNREQLNHPPHDHGPTWAIYGQAAGETEMSEWLHIEPPGCEQHSFPVLKKLYTYHLKRGDVYLYKVGDIHSPLRSPGAKLVRIEGTDIDTVVRRSYEQYQSND